MLEYIYRLMEEPGTFRLFSYVSFRSIMAALFALAFSFITGPALIRWLQSLKFKETIRTDGPGSHQAKAGTPTMGGLMILISLFLSSILFGNFTNPLYNTILVATLALGGIGFWDDYSKVVLKKKNGMNARMKMGLTLIVAFGFSYFHLLYAPDSTSDPEGIPFDSTGIFVPFIKGQVLELAPYLAMPFWMLVMLGASHGVNLTDGLDGLAIGTVTIVAGTFAIFAYLTGTPLAAHYLNIPMVEGGHELVVFLAALIGAGVGFLWYNAAPAMVFMGDTGSLALGGALGMTAVMIKKELLFVITGGVFVAEALSVILQVGYFKMTRKRIFRMAPLHHHFELKGWPETRVVIRFWLVGIILALFSFSTLKLQ